jgi:hypothetical protein
MHINTMSAFLQVVSFIIPLNMNKKRVYLKRENSIPVIRKALLNDLSRLWDSMKVGQVSTTDEDPSPRHQGF